MTTAPTIELRVERPPGPPDLTAADGLPDGVTALEPASSPFGQILAPASPMAPTQMRARARRFVQALVEIVDGDRPAIQLLRMSTEAVYDDLVDRLDSLACLSTRGAHPCPLSTQVASVHVNQPGLDYAEVSARIVQGGRSRALALRLDLLEGRWVCSAIRWG
ncbi:MAG: Rv3235 family protein [Actinomycetia bacterium]|nr:Rv3235 family protein [Actinomycetes bacterium]